MSALDELAQVCGIEDVALDARGHQLATKRETKRALLTAMGLDASTETLAAEALEEISNREWQRAIPAVMVVEASDMSIPITLPIGTEAISWTLSLEADTEFRGTASFNDMKLLGEGKRGETVLQRRNLVLHKSIPWGYHKFQLDGQPDELTLIVTPRSCWLPEALQAGEQVWGISTQPYLQRSDSNWGIGDSPTFDL